MEVLVKIQDHLHLHTMKEFVISVNHKLYQDKNQQLNTFIAEKDIKKISSNKIIRLKDLMNIEFKSIDLSQNIVKVEYHSQKLERSFPIIQWIPESDYINVSILKPDGTNSTGYGELN